MEEAIRRSLQENKAIALKGEGTLCYAHTTLLTVLEEEMLPLSEGEDAQELHKLSINKVEGWIADDKITSNSIDGNVIHPADNPNDWEVKSTPKTIRNRAALPRTSLLTLQHSEPTDKSSSPVKDKQKMEPANTATTPVKGNKVIVPTNKGRAQGNGNKKTFAQVTRTFNPESDTVTVGNLPQRRRGRGNKTTYLDITRELHYRR